MAKLSLAFTVMWTLMACNNAQANNTNTNKPAPTVDLFVAQYLESAMGSNPINITTKYCTWNVTLIVKRINDTDPEWFFLPQNVAALPQYLPPYIIQQLPQSLLDFYGLDYSNTSITGCGDGSGLDVTLAPFEVDVCVGPLIHSQHDNPLKHEEARTLNLKNLTGFDYYLNLSLSECGLSCAAGNQMFGLTESEQRAVDIFKIIGCVLCFIAMVCLAGTQYMDLKKNNEKFFQKPLLQMIPYVLTLAGFGIVCSMALGEIIGKEHILCSANEFSFYNPFKGKNASCTIHGLFFYSFVQLYEYYTVLLSFVIFRQVYAPMNPLWNIRDRWWHACVCLPVLIFDIIAISINSFAGVYPMSVCFPGFTNKHELLVLIDIPLFICLFFSVIFILGSAYLLRLQLVSQKKYVNKESTTKMQDLVQRYCIYAIGELCALILLNVTSIMFYVKMDALEQEMKDLIQCELEQVLLNSDKVCNRVHSMPTFWFLSWIITSILAIFSQVILSCHTDNRDKVKQRLATMTGLSTERSKTHSPRSPNSPSQNPVSINNSINIELTHGDIGSGTGGVNAIVSLQSDDEDADTEKMEDNNQMQTSDCLHSIGSIVVGSNLMNGTQASDGLQSDEDFIAAIIDEPTIMTNNESVHL